MKARVACAVLAAGASRRLGHPKQLVLHCTEPLVRLAASRVLLSRAADCAVVVGAHALSVRAALDGLTLALLENPHWEEGVASSIRAAVTWAAGSDCDALLLAVCDQPRLSSAHLDRLISEFERTGGRAASRYADKNGVPALFPKADFDALAALRGDSGASSLLNGPARVSPVVWPDGELDLDTREAEQRLVDANARPVASS